MGFLSILSHSLHNLSMALVKEDNEDLIQVQSLRVSLKSHL